MAVSNTQSWTTCVASALRSSSRASNSSSVIKTRSRDSSVVDAVLDEDEDTTASSKGVCGGSKSLVVGVTVLDVEVEVKVLEEKLEVVEGEVELRA